MDQRHADIIIEEMGMKDAKGVSTPTEAEKAWEENTNDEELDQGKATRFRKIDARANYLAQDRSDIQYAVKELARSMSCPTREYWRALVKLGKYLKTHTRCSYLYKYQDLPEVLTIWTDTDYAGCKKTRKSTSGGVIMRGDHIIK